jgi:tetratricopeptide (TPR) repeat protein
MWSTVLLLQARRDEAIRLGEQAVEEDPLEVWPRMNLHAYLQAAGRDRDACEQVTRVLQIDPNLAAALRLSGEEEEARVLVERLGSGEGVGDCRARALYHLLCGEIDAGADWTEKAIIERNPGMLFYLCFPFSRPLRTSSRWAQIAGMLKGSAAAFAVPEEDRR